LVLGASAGDAAAVCTEFGGSAVFQCGDLAFFAPVPDPNFAPAADPATGRITNIAAVFWQIGFGNATLNTGLGSLGTGNSDPATFNGNDSGLAAVDLADARAATGSAAVPPGSVCLRNNNWGNFRIDGSCDNHRTALLLAINNDDILNPYYDVYYARNGYPGRYSLDWQQDYPMAALLKTLDGRFFAFAAVSTMNRGNQGNGEDGPCNFLAPSTNVAPCDFRSGFY
jgi:hypothetical protein